MAMRTSVSRRASERHSASAMARVWRANALIRGPPKPRPPAPPNPPPDPPGLADLRAAGTPEPAAEPRCTSNADTGVADLHDDRVAVEYHSPDGLHRGAHVVGGVALEVVVSEHHHHRDGHRRNLGGELSRLL